jgi:hypothetical protein
VEVTEWKRQRGRDRGERHMRQMERDRGERLEREIIREERRMGSNREEETEVKRQRGEN